MRQIAVVGAIGILGAIVLLFTSCDDRPVKDQAIIGCMDDNDAADQQLGKVAGLDWSKANFDTGDLHDALTKAISSCKAAVLLFPVDSQKPPIAEAAKTCKAAYDMKVLAFQKFISRDSNDSYYLQAATALGEGSDMVKQCKADMIDIKGFHKYI
jgi:hypothetical protein